MGRDDPLTLLFVQIWLFGTSLSAFEAVFFSGGSPHWFMMVAAIIGLRYQTHDANCAGESMLSPTPCLLSINNYFYPRGGAEVAVPRAEPDVRGHRLAGGAVRDAAREESADAMGRLFPR